MGVKKSTKKFTKRLPDVIRRRHQVNKIKRDRSQQERRKAARIHRTEREEEDAQLAEEERKQRLREAAALGEPVDDDDDEAGSDAGSESEGDDAARVARRQAASMRRGAAAAEDEGAEGKPAKPKRTPSSSIDEFMSTGFADAINNLADEGDDDGEDGDEDEDAEDGGSDAEGEERDVVDGEDDEDAVPGADELEGDDELDGAGAGAEADGAVDGDERVRGAADEVAKHKRELEHLRATDKEFYEFLAKNDPTLLGFGDGEGDDDKGADDVELPPPRRDEGEEDDDLVTGDAGELASAAAKKPLTAKILEVLVANAGKSQKHFRRLLLAFQAGCHISDENAGSVRLHYRIVNGDVFNRLMTFCLGSMVDVFEAHMAGDADADAEAEAGDDKAKSRKRRRRKAKAVDLGSPLARAQQLKNDAAFHEVSPYVRSFLGNAVFFLSELNEHSMRAFALQNLEKYIPFFAQYAALSRKYLKELLTLWSTGDEPTRLLAFANIRALAIACPSPFVNLCLKGVYLTYVRTSGSVSTGTLPLLTFMRNCVVELYGLDYSASYQFAFIYVRQLALYLRNMLASSEADDQSGGHAAPKAKGKKDQLQKPKRKGPTAAESIHTWPYLNALYAWVEVISAHAPQSEALRHLVFPVSQVITGLLELSPGTSHVALRFHCVRMLIRLSECTGAFVNPVHYLLQCLDLSEIKGKAKQSRVKALEWEAIIRVPKQYAGTRELQEGIVSQVYELLLHFFAMHSHSIAFPEIALPAIVFFKRYRKESSNPALGRQLAALIEKIKENIEYINKHRVNVSFTPKDTDKVQAFLAEERKANKSPLAQSWVRYKTQQEKYKQQEQEKRAAQAKEEAAQEKKKKTQDVEEDDAEGAGVYGSEEEDGAEDEEEEEEGADDLSDLDDEDGEDREDDEAMDQDVDDDEHDTGIADLSEGDEAQLDQSDDDEPQQSRSAGRKRGARRAGKQSAGKPSKKPRRK
eukprot:m51a1_g11991 putative nucleolar complex protein 2 homolog (976) ;mRNA; r:899056-902281